MVLSGSQEAQQRAKEMIEELISSSSSDNRRRGGGNSGYAGYGGYGGSNNQGGYGGSNNQGPNMSSIDALADRPPAIIDWDEVNRHHVSTSTCKELALF